MSRHWSPAVCWLQLEWSSSKLVTLSPSIAIWAAVPDVLLLVRQRVMDVGIANHQILKYNFGIDPEGSLGLVLSLEIGILSVNIF